MRLVDADALKEKAFGKRGGLIHTSDIDACTTVDAVPVVRCKDCKHWRKYTDEQLGECMTTIRDTKVTRSDDYCSESERKDGKQDG